MALTFINGSYVYGYDTSKSISLPASIVEGDILFATISRQQSLGTTINPPTTIPTGWDLVPGTVEHDIGLLDAVSVYYKIAGPSEVDPIIWGWDIVGRTGIAISAWRGNQNLLNPFFDVSDIEYTTSNTTLRAGSVSSNVAGKAILFLGVVNKYSTVLTVSAPSSPASFTDDYYNGNINGAGYHFHYSLIWSGTGETGNIDGTISTGEGAKHAFAIVLNSTDSSVSNKPFLLFRQFI